MSNDRFDASAHDDLLLAMLREDIGDGDVTTALFPPSARFAVACRARSAGVMCGGSVVARLFELHDPSVETTQLVAEGERFEPGASLLRFSGAASSILTVERTALNLLARLCGIATRTALLADIVAGRAVLLDTRKTTPLLRSLEKYAVRTGGGQNHRMGLYDQVLVKDNHLALLGSEATDMASLVAEARRRYGPGMVVEVEVDTEQQFDALLAAAPDIILLDNMPPALMARCAAKRDEFHRQTGRRVLLEASGGVTAASIGAIADSGVDRISVGSLTYNPVMVDIGLDFEERLP